MREAIAVGVLVGMVGCAPDRLVRVEEAELDHRLEEAASAAPAVVFGAIWRDGRSIVRAVGSADLRTGRAVARSTPFAWFSVTKLFTAVAVLQLVEAGRVDLDAPVSAYLPETRLRRGGREATVRQLLSHAAGLPNPIPITWVHLATEPGPGLDELTRSKVGRVPELRSTPGERFAYSNVGYLLLGQIVERASGEPFERYVEDHVLGPLGCEATGFSVPGDRATAYQRRWSLMGIAARFMLDGRFFGATVGGHRALLPFTVDGAPYGGLSGPIDDLLRLGEMILSGGQAERGRVLSSGAVATMLAPQASLDGSLLPAGLGWHLGELDGEPYAYHVGGGGGFRSELRVYPRLGYAVAVLANETSFPTEDLTRIVVR